MAKISWGILDGFIGKVGTVVGSFWKGKPVMRAYKRQIRNRNSEAQQLVRTRFAAITSLSGAFLSAIRLGLAEVARRNRTTEGNVFIQLNWDHVHAAIPGTATIDFADLLIAKGNLPEAQLDAPSFTTPLEVDVAQVDSSSIIGADSDDMVFLYVYSPEAKAGILSDPYSRTEETLKVTVPDYWNGHLVHVWGFAIGAGPDNEGRISNSRHLGSGTIS